MKISMRFLVYIFLLFFAVVLPAQGATYYGHPDCSDNPSSPLEQVGTYDCSTHTCTDSDPASDACYLKQAVSMSTIDGDVVELADGVYTLKASVTFPNRTGTTTLKALNRGAVTVTSLDAITRLFDLTGASNWQIQGLVFDGNSKTLHGIETSTSKAALYYNIFKNCNSGIRVGDTASGQGKDIQNNLVYDSVYPMVWNGNWNDCIVKNNTFVDNDNVLYFSGFWTSGNDVSNNLIAWNHGTSGEQILFTNLPGIFQNNNVYSDQTGSQAYDYIAWRYDSSPSAVDATNMSFVPVFTDRANDDYTLAPTSLLVDKGVASTQATDLAGNVRTQGNGVDIGCFESSITGSVTYTVTPTPNKVVIIGHSIAAGYDPGNGAVGFGGDAIDPSQANTPAQFLYDHLGPTWTVINWGIPGLHSAATPFLAYRALAESPEWVMVGPGWINSMTVDNVTPDFIAGCATETVRILKSAGIDPRKIILVGTIAEDSQPDIVENVVGHYTPEAFSAAEIRDAFVDVALAEGVLFADVYHVIAGAEIPNWNTTFFNNVDNDVHPNVTHGYPMLGRLWYNMMTLQGKLFIQDATSVTSNEISLYPLCEAAGTYTNAANNGCILTSDNSDTGTPFSVTTLGVRSNQKIVDLPAQPDLPVLFDVDPTVSGFTTLTLSHDGNDRQGTSLNLELGVPTKNLDMVLSTLDLGIVFVGSSSPAQITTLSNTGTDLLTLGTITLTGPNASEFILQGDTCSSASLSSTQGCQIDVVLQPGSVGPKTATLSIPFPDLETTIIDVPLSGTGLDPADTDGDGYDSIDFGGTDCDDTDATVYPSAAELCDGLDNNCDTVTPVIEIDDDSDGYVECTLDPGGWDGPVSKQGDDCDDMDGAVHPGAVEGPYGDATCSDLKDNDCDGTTDSVDTNCAPTSEIVGYIREDCTGYTNCYTSLSAWQANKGGIDFTGCTAGDLTCADKIAVAEIDGPWTQPDTTAVLINGWTTDAARYVKIYTTPSARHNGTWGTGYRLETLSMNEITSSYVKVEGLSISTGTSNVDTLAVTGPGTTGVEIGYCLIFNGHTGTSWRDAFYTYDLGAGNDVKIYNSIAIVSSAGASSAAIEAVSQGTLYASNVTAVNTSTGNGYVFKATNNGSIVTYNSLGWKGANGNVFGTSGGSLACSYCASTDTTAGSYGGTGNRVSQTFAFVDAPNNDYHLDSSDTGAKDYGDNSDPNFSFTDDVDGIMRGGPWDIGADEDFICSASDTTCDGIDDNCDGFIDEGCTTDADSDGLYDSWEIYYFGDLATADALSDYDSDGATDLAEFQNGSDPLIVDTDSDGLLDGSDPLPLDYNYQDGDLDESGVVDVADALIAVRIASGLIPPTIIHLQHGDITPMGGPDGQIDISDALLVMRKAAGLVSF